MGRNEGESSNSIRLKYFLDGQNKEMMTAYISRSLQNWTSQWTFIFKDQVHRCIKFLSIYNHHRTISSQWRRNLSLQRSLTSRLNSWINSTKRGLSIFSAWSGWNFRRTILLLYFSSWILPPLPGPSKPRVYFQPSQPAVHFKQENQSACFYLQFKHYINI